MELYILDALLRRIEIIDTFESLIWTERFAIKGDFQLVIPSTVDNRRRLKAGVLLACNVSFRVMRIDTVEDTISDDGRRMLNIKGPSIETILEDRVAKDTLSDTTAEPKWIITDTPTNVARQIFHDICVTGNLSTADIIPFINIGTFLSPGNILEPDDIITTDLDPTDVYSAINDLASVWQFGFRLLRFYDTSQLFFDIYMGSDRTSSQMILPAVIFAPELENLQNTSELTTIAGAKNVAYVFSPAGYQVVYADGVDPDVDGFDRRVLMVNATDITSENPDIPAALIQKGREELGKLRAVSAFDGEISQYSQYIYGVHYQLGDIVEQRNSDGVISHMRVAEQIFVSDEQGERSYPTLALNEFINPGSWPTYGDTVWSDFVGETWSDLP